MKSLPPRDSSNSVFFMQLILSDIFTVLSEIDTSEARAIKAGLGLYLHVTCQILNRLFLLLIKFLLLGKTKGCAVYYAVPCRILSVADSEER